MADVLTQKEILIAEALGRCALICYMYNIVIRIPEKFYLESDLYKLDSFPIKPQRDLHFKNRVNY